MLNELLIKVIKDKQYLLTKFNHLYDDISPESIISKWTDHEFNDNTFSKKVLAVDGSINYQNLISETIYALSSNAIYYNSNPGYERLSVQNNVEIMPNSIDSYNSIFLKQMNIFELKTILNSLYSKTDVDYLLLDGDFFSILNHVASIVNTSLRSNPFVQSFTKQIIENEKNNFNLEVPSVQSLIDEIPKDLNLPINEIVLYFQMIEQLCIIKKILENYSHKIISISKTSRTRTLYENEYFSDLSLITKYCNKSGYSDENIVEDTRFRAYINHSIQYGQYPIYNDFFIDLTFTNRFVKLTDRGSVLKVQLAYKASEDDFLQVFDDLRYLSLESSGYPYLLKKVHDDVKISSKDINLILKQLDKNYDLKERNVL